MCTIIEAYNRLRFYSIIELEAVGWDLYSMVEDQCLQSLDL